MPLNTKKGIRWRFFFFLTYIGAIYCTLPFGRTIVERIRATGLLSALAYVLTTILLLFFLKDVLTHFKGASLYSKAASLLVPSLVVFFMFITLKLPEERLHFVEYGILGYMGGWVLNGLEPFHHRFKAGFLILFSIGLFDELIQGILPNRVFDIHDILWDTLSSWCGFWIYWQHVIGAKSEQKI